MSFSKSHTLSLSPWLCFSVHLSVWFFLSVFQSFPYGSLCVCVCVHFYLLSSGFLSFCLLISDSAPPDFFTVLSLFLILFLFLSSSFSVGFSLLLSLLAYIHLLLSDSVWILNSFFFPVSQVLFLFLPDPLSDCLFLLSLCPCVCPSVCASGCVCVCSLSLSASLYRRGSECVSLSDSRSLSHTVCLCFSVSRSSYLPAAPSLPACSGAFPCKVPSSHSLSFLGQAGCGGAPARLGLCLSLAVREKKATSGPKSGVPRSSPGQGVSDAVAGSRPPPDTRVMGPPVGAQPRARGRLGGARAPLRSRAFGCPAPTPPCPGGAAV